MLVLPLKNCKDREKCFNCGEKNSKNHVILIEGVDNNPTSYVTFVRRTTEVLTEYIRQQKIKILMAYENLTYHDASNACKKTYRTPNDFFYNPSDFPQTTTQTPKK